MNRYLWGIKIKNVKLEVYKHSYLLLLIPVIIIALPLLKPGSIIGDGDFPFTHNALAPDKILSTWIDFGSRNASEVLSRYPLIVIGLALQLMNISSEVISKLMIISGFLVSSFSFYFSFYLLFKNKIDTRSINFKAAAILGSLFYAYNVWSFDRISHWYLWIGYGILPLFLVSLICAFDKPGKRWRYVLIAVLSWTVASATPHMFAFFGFIFIGVSSFFVIKNIHKKQDLIKSGLLALLILSVYVLLNSYWLYPLVLSIRSWSIDPSALFGIVVTEETTKMFSENSSFLNVFRLLQDLPNFFESDAGVPPNTSSLYPAWLFASFLVPILAFSALFFKTFIRYALIFSGIAIVGIILSMGTNIPLNFYSSLLFEIPISSSIRNLLRDPDKLAFLIPLAYSFLLSLTSFGLLTAVEKIRFKKIISGLLLFALFGLITITLSQIYKVPFENEFEPTVIPSDFNDVNNYLRNVKTDKVLNIPYFSETTLWNSLRHVSDDFYELSSISPNTGSFSLLPANYYRYLTDSIIENKTNNIYNHLVPFGTSYVIFHNDTLSSQNTNLLKRIPSLHGIENVKNVGLFRIFNVDNSILPVGIPELNFFVLGGLNKITSLYALDYFNSTKSSIIFLDQNVKKENSNPANTSATSGLILSKSANDFFLSLLNDKYIIAPFQATNHHDPSRVWSKSGVMDLLHGDFHPYLEELGMQNWDLDYGKGLVITKAGAKLSVPFKVEEAGNHDIFFRYLKNQKGGQIQIYLDGKLLNEVDTFNKISNDFVWEKIGSMNLTKATHTLTLENVAGFNAANIFAVVPHYEIGRLGENAYLLANNTRNIFLLEAESDFYNNKGRQLDVNVFPFSTRSNESNNATNTGINGIINETLTNQFKVPANSDLVALQFLAKQNPYTMSIYEIKNLEVTPSEANRYIYTSYFEREGDQSIFDLDFERGGNQSIFDLDFERGGNQSIFDLDFERGGNQSIFDLDFEREKVSIFSTALRHFASINHKELSNTIETNRPMYGNDSLRVDIKPSNATNWNTISTDFIPINENAYYNASLDISAKDVNQLHSKIIYFDSNKSEIKSVFISGGRNGTFEETNKIVDVSPNGTKYMQLQLWVKPNQNMSSSYIIDNVKIESVPLGQVSFTNNNKDFLLISTETNRPIFGNGSLRVDIKPGNTTNWNTISTDFIPVNDPVSLYNYSLDISAKDVNQLHSKIIYFDSNKSEIKSVFISGGRNGTFEETNKIVDVSPNGTKYMQLQLWVRSNPIIASSFLIDNIMIRDITNYAPAKIKPNDFQNLNTTGQNLTIRDKDGFLRVELKKGNSTSNEIIQTKPIPVKENHIYNYTMTVEGENMNSFNGLASFRKSDDVVENSTKYGANASNGNVLSLSPGSEIYTNLDILKPSNYTVALRAMTCETCTFLRTSIVSAEDDNISTNTSIKTSNISLKGKGSELNWVYSNNTYLDRGKYEIRIYSDSQTDLDSVIIYSLNSNARGIPDSGTSTIIDKKYNETIEDLFNTNDVPPLAQVSEYKKVNPTKHLIKISNATKPYLLSFAESYDPLWIAHIENNNSKVTNVPLYSMINGFYINKTGDYNLTIEYHPQKWFIEGVIVSIASLIIIIGYSVVQRQNKKYSI